MASPEQKVNNASKAPFSVKSWRAHRESVAKGCGVAKAISMLEGLGMNAQGSLKGVPDEKLTAALMGYKSILKPAVKKAQNKSKKSPFTAFLCEYMLEAIEDESKKAEKRTAVFEKNSKAEYAIKVEDKKLGSFLKDMAVEMSKCKLVFDKSGQAMAKSLSDMGKIMKSSALTKDQKNNTIINVFRKAEKEYNKPLINTTDSTFKSIVKLRATMGKVTKKSDKMTVKMEVQFVQVVNALELSRGKAQSAFADATTYLAKAKEHLSKS